MIFGRQDDTTQVANTSASPHTDTSATTAAAGQSADDGPVDLATISGLNLSDNGSDTAASSSYLDQLTAASHETTTAVPAPPPTVISPTPPTPEPAMVANHIPEPASAPPTATSSAPMDLPQPASLSSSSPASISPTPPTSPINPDDLLALKQQALNQLTPLVGQLEQTPEERFRTTMMMIQSADNQSLIKDAYEAAQAISDDKVRAQALLDVINEINYFTQQQLTQQPQDSNK